ncbi:MAG TPA: hypothetical protein VKV27_01530 [Solirubrobacteraceae bacterium]|nr:hypothetical protein [Solirubrobacteraceae bacterium]
MRRRQLDSRRLPLGQGCQRGLSLLPQCLDQSLDRLQERHGIRRLNAPAHRVLPRALARERTLPRDVGLAVCARDALDLTARHEPVKRPAAHPQQFGRLAGCQQVVIAARLP